KQDADHVVIASAGSGGHIYTLDMNSETLADRGALGAASWHSFNMTADGTRGFGSSPLSDEVIVIDLTTTPVTNLGSIRFDQVPGLGNNQPDAFGGGEVISGNVLPVGLRAAGNVAVVNAHNLTVRALVNLEPPAPFNLMTCGPVGPPTGAGGCAVHGVTPRPRYARGRSTSASQAPATGCAVAGALSCQAGGYLLPLRRVSGLKELFCPLP